jgi:hypothetical protein
MVNSRREFLEKGFYEEISLKVNEVLLANLGNEETINIGSHEKIVRYRIRRRLLHK